MCADRQQTNRVLTVKGKGHITRIWPFESSARRGGFVKGRRAPFRRSCNVSFWDVSSSGRLRSDWNCFCTPASGRQLALHVCTKHVLRVNRLRRGDGYCGQAVRLPVPQRPRNSSVPPDSAIQKCGLAPVTAVLVIVRLGRGADTHSLALVIPFVLRETGPCVQSKRLRSGRLRMATWRDHLLRGVPNESFLAVAGELSLLRIFTLANFRSGSPLVLPLTSVIRRAHTGRSVFSF